MENVQTKAPIDPESIKGAPVLYDVAMKRFDAFMANVAEAHRRTGTIFGAANVLVAGAVVVLTKDSMPELPAMVVAGLLALLYGGIAWSSWYAMKLRDYHVLADPILLARNNQALSMGGDQLKGFLFTSVVEPCNQRLIDEINRKGKHLQRALWLTILLAIGVFVCGMSPPLLKGRDAMSKRENKAKAPEVQREPPPSEKTAKRLDPIQTVAQAVTWNEDRTIAMGRRLQPEKK